jgi:3-hydroxyisobutyrate dehydrogenase-like beta-hydroxyacid dehydrogenase
VYSQKIINVGKEHAVANRLKLINNYILLVLIDLMGQVFTVSEKSNIDLNVVNQVMEMIFSSPTLQEYAKRISTRDFDNVGYSLTLAFKDVQLILESSTDVRAPLSYASGLREKFLAAIAKKLETKDCIAIYEITRMFAWLKLSG